MGMQASIDVKFTQNYLPKDLVLQLIKSGWIPIFDGKVTFLVASDIDSYDWQCIDHENFNMSRFLQSHQDMDKIGIVLVNDNIGGELLIYPDWLTISLSINRVYLSEVGGIPDFSWYLIKLSSFIKNVKVSSIECELVYWWRIYKYRYT